MSQASAGRGIDMAEVSKHEGCLNLSCMDRRKTSNISEAKLEQLPSNVF